MKREKIIELLKSGDFTILYHDNGSCQLYRGKSDYVHAKGHGVDFTGWSVGYIPVEVSHLVEALGGSVDTI